MIPKFFAGISEPSPLDSISKFVESKMLTDPRNEEVPPVLFISKAVVVAGAKNLWYLLLGVNRVNPQISDRKREIWK